jgi:hypothetical protein
MIQDFPTFQEEFKKNLLSKKPSKRIIEWQKDGSLKKHFIQLDRCVGVHQDPKFHQDDVFSHCIKTCDNVPPIPSLRWAALLHDIGKYDVRSWHILCGLCLPEKKIIGFCRLHNKKCFKECNHAVERITFYRHEIASERTAKKVIKRYDVEPKIKKEAILLISLHMYNYTSAWTDKAINRFVHSSGITARNLSKWEKFPLFRLRMADRISRGLEPISEKQVDFINTLKCYFNGPEPLLPIEEYDENE